MPSYNHSENKAFITGKIRLKLVKTNQFSTWPNMEKCYKGKICTRYSIYVTKLIYITILYNKLHKIIMTQFFISLITPTEYFSYFFFFRKQWYCVLKATDKLSSFNQFVVEWINAFLILLKLFSNALCTCSSVQII